MLDCVVLVVFFDEVLVKRRNYLMKIYWENRLGRGRGYFKGFRREER